MTYVPLYASLLGLMFVVLSIRTLRLRRSLRIAIGDSGNPQMLRAMRVHASFAENVPVALLLLYMAEAGGAAALGIHVLGLALLAGRCAHAVGFSQPREDYRFRVFGMGMTFAAIIGVAVLNLYLVATRAGA